MSSTSSNARRNLGLFWLVLIGLPTAVALIFIALAIYGMSYAMD